MLRTHSKLLTQAWMSSWLQVLLPLPLPLPLLQQLMLQQTGNISGGAQ
jgi:hypothetical protein